MKKYCNEYTQNDLHKNESMIAIYAFLLCVRAQDVVARYTGMHVYQCVCKSFVQSFQVTQVDKALAH